MSVSPECDDTYGINQQMDGPVSAKACRCGLIVLMRLVKPSAGLLLMGEENRVKIRSRMPGRGPCSDHSQNKKFNLICLHIDVTV